MTSPPGPQEVGAPVARLPGRAPSRAELAERDAFAARAAGSLEAVRASAKTWRNGLSAFITLVTTGVVISGRGTAAELARPWLLVITVLVGGGLVLAVLGLWQALAAEAGVDPKRLTLAQVRETYGSLTAHDVAVASRSADRLRRARWLVGPAIVALLAGVALTWWAPPADTSTARYLRVSHGHEVTCGTVESAHGGELRLSVTGLSTPVVVPMTDITGLAVTSTCS
jgi:hypothetical protein